MLYLEVTAVDPVGKSISQLVHFLTVQRRLFVAKVRDKLIADLQASLGVLRQDASKKIVQSLIHDTGSHCDPASDYSLLMAVVYNKSFTILQHSYIIIQQNIIQLTIIK